MDITFNAKQLIEFFKDKEKYFHNQSDYLCACHFLVLFFPKYIISFPPNDKVTEFIVKWLNESDEKEILRSDNYGHSEAEYNETILDVYTNGISQMHSLPIDDSSSFMEMFFYSLCISHLYRLLVNSEDLIKDSDFIFINQIDALGVEAIKVSSALVGYWKARMEVRKQKRNNVLSGSKVLEHKEIIKSLYEKYDRKNCFAFRVEAQKAIYRSDRTVLNLLKEIKEEMHE